LVVIAYERFEAWKAAHQLALMLYRATDGWPRAERFGITAQVRRAALSVPTNIAEGAARRGRREFRRFLDIAFGSLAELSYLLRFSRDYGLLEEEAWTTLEAQRDLTGRLVWGLYRAVARPTHTPDPHPPTA
jgi:four helix bundle protein